MKKTMKLKIIRGDPMIYAVGLASHGTVLDAAYHTTYASGPAIRENLKFFQDELIARRDHGLVGVELKNGFSPRTVMGEFKGRYCHNALYLLLDETAKEILEIEGMCKGYAGEGVRGAIAVDTALDLLGIEILRQRICRNFIRQERREVRYFNLPPFNKPVFDPSHVPRARRRARKARIQLVKPAGFDRLKEGMELEDVLRMVDFYEHGRFH
jgi:hypothetical protein